MKRWMIVTASAVLIVVLGFFAVFYFVRSTREWAQTLSWADPNLATIADGVYLGTAKVTLPRGTASASTTATVKVTIRDHRYVAVEVVGPASIATGMTEFAQTIIEEQSVRPDSISGATVSKSVVLMAVANALEGE